MLGIAHFLPTPTSDITNRYCRQSVIALRFFMGAFNVRCVQNASTLLRRSTPSPPHAPPRGCCIVAALSEELGVMGIVQERVCCGSVRLGFLALWFDRDELACPVSCFTGWSTWSDGRSINRWYWIGKCVQYAVLFCALGYRASVDHGWVFLLFHRPVR